MSDFCEPCWRNHGLKVLAHRMTKTGPKCDACWRNNVEVLAAPAPEETAAPAQEPKLAVIPRPFGGLKPKEEKTMQGKKADINWVAVQQDRDAGMKLREIAAKYDVSTPTICQHTRPAPKDGAKRAAKPRAAKAARAEKSDSHAPAARGNYAAVLADIEARITQLQAAAAGIRAIMGI